MTNLSSFRRLLGGIAGLAVITALLSGVAAETAGAGPGYQEPTKGDCRTLSLKQFRARSSSSAPVACTSTHTAQTIYVGKLPGRLSWRSPRGRVTDAIETRCAKAWRKAVGGTAKKRARSAFALATFEPTKAQKRKGARWFRCDAGLLRGTSMTPLTTTRAPLLMTPTPYDQARCMTSSERITTCDAAHAFKATHTFKVKGKRYPGKPRVKRLAKQGCKTRVATAAFRFEWPSRVEWAERNRLVVCFSSDVLAVGSDTTKPVVKALTSPPSLLPTTSDFVINGSATDNVAVSTLLARVTNDAGRFLQDNLTTFSTTANDLPITVTGLGTPNASYNLNTGKRAAGAYTVVVQAADAAGNLATRQTPVTVTNPSSGGGVVYQMNEGPGATTMIDTGGSNLHGAISPTAAAHGLTSGVGFQGATGYLWAFRSPTEPPAEPERVIQVPDNSILDAGSDVFTIEIRYRTNNSFGNIMQKGQATSAGGQWKIQAPGGRPSCLFKDGAGNRSTVRSSIDLSDTGQWATLRCVRDASYVTMYINGVRNGRNSASNVGTINNNAPLTIGGKRNCDQIEVTCDYFSGSIDYVTLTHS